MKEFLLSFIPILVAMDALGVVPIYMAFTDGLSKKEKARVLTQSIITALVIGVGFLVLGRWIFKILGVLVSDFKIAGGLVLLAIALRDILLYDRSHKVPADTVGAVPIGTPLITGPAVLTTIVILLDSYGVFFTISSFILNLLIAWLVFANAGNISAFLGKAGTKAFSKIAHLLLAAIAVMMIRKGIVDTAANFFLAKG